MECLNAGGCVEEKRTLSVHWGRAVLITIGTKLLDTKYAFCGFNDDLIETVN